MLWILFTQVIDNEADFGIVEDVKGKKAKFYNLEGILGVWWGYERLYYRGEGAFQMQFDEGFYGRLSVISFDEYYFFPTVRLKELYVEKLYDNGLDVKFGLGPIFWENGVVFGDYLGGNPFLSVFFGKEIWGEMLLYKITDNMGVALRGALDLGNFTVGVYGIYDTVGLGYVGTSLNLDLPFLAFSLEATAQRYNDDYNGAFMLHTFVRPSSWFIGLLAYSFTPNFKRMIAQGLELDPNNSPFFGVSTYLTYTTPGIPWTYPQNTSAQVLRFGFEKPLNEDWNFKPFFDVGAYQSEALNMGTSGWLADVHLRFDWTDTYYTGFSGGVFLKDGNFNWSLAIYSVKNVSF
ncbi:MAG: hypothetical protein GXO39_00930 [Thermotogae bacterium]|nr:hypothetical protein [Thermotogota bacterium]